MTVESGSAADEAGEPSARWKEVWESRDRGDSWAPLQLEGQNLGALLALASS